MLSAVPPLAPGSCVGGLDWSATVAASGQSTLAGVLAGFVFGGIVVVLSVRMASRSEEAANALKLLFCAFFGLAAVAYLLADQAGDKNCLRATSEETLSGGILGTFAIVLIVSLTWLIVAYDRHAHGVLQFLRHLIYVVSAFVVLLLCTSSFSYVQAEVTGPSSEVTILIYLAGGLLYLIAVPVGPRVARSLPARITRRSGSTGHRSAAVTGIIHREERSPVDRCALAALGYLAAAAVADAIVLGLPSTAWDRPQVPVVYAVAWSSLLFPLGVLILALRALAPGQAAADGAAQEPANPPDHQKGPELAADVDQNLLRQRFESYIVDHYTGLHNTVISVVLAVAGLSAASLAGSHAQYGGSYPLLWMFWVASLLLCATIFAGAMSGNVAAPPLMPAITDLLVPLLLGVGEFVLFGVLAHQVTGLNKTSSIAEAWFISLAVVCVCAAVAITRAMRFFGAATYATEISVPIDEYRYRCLPADRAGALATAGMGIGGAAASAVQVGWLEYVLAGCAIAGFLLGLRGHARSAAVLRTAMQLGHGARTAESLPQGLPRANSGQAAAGLGTGTGWPA